MPGWLTGEPVNGNSSGYHSAEHLVSDRCPHLAAVQPALITRSFEDHFDPMFVRFVQDFFPEAIIGPVPEQEFILSGFLLPFYLVFQHQGPGFAFQAEIDQPVGILVQS